MNLPHASANVAIMLAVTDSANSAVTKKATENDVVQVESIHDHVASLCRRYCTIRHEVGRNECGKEVDDADTLKRAISERMRVIRLPSH